MQRMFGYQRTVLCFVGAYLVTASTAAAGAQPAQATSPAGRDLTVVPSVPASSLPAATGDVSVARGPVEFWPPLDGAALTWFAVVVILALSLRLKPLLCERNLDALVLAATCLLLGLRADCERVPLGGPLGGHTGQWWSYLLLSVAGVYWLLRGLRGLLARTIARHESSLTQSALFIFMLAGLAIGVQHIATAPLSGGSRDGLVGGLYTAATGKLPYGESLGHDARSPLLYLLHAGAVWVVPPEVGPPESQARTAMSWADRGSWQERAWWQEGDFAAARLVNALLYVLFLLSLYVIGRRLNSVALGLTMATIFAVFPGAVECVTRPDIMAPATLLSWSLAAALVPGISGLLSCLLAILAGVAWPWAWLALPVLLAYSFRHGWESVGGVLGTLGGSAACLAGVFWLTLPSLPRAEGVLQRAGLAPTYTVSRSEDGSQLLVTPREPGPASERGWLRPFWNLLLASENLLLDPTGRGPALSPVRLGDADARKLLYHRLEPTDAAREEVTRRYRAALTDQPVLTRLRAALRTVLEQTWLAKMPPTSPYRGVWALWSVGAPEYDSRWLLIRKLTKAAAGALALLVALVMLRGRQPQAHHLVGGLLVVSSATLLADSVGTIGNLVWLLPTVLALWAVQAQPPAAAASKMLAAHVPFEGVPPPRITVEK